MRLPRRHDGHGRGLRRAALGAGTITLLATALAACTSDSTPAPSSVDADRLAALEAAVGHVAGGWADGNVPQARSAGRDHGTAPGTVRRGSAVLSVPADSFPSAVAGRGLVDAWEPARTVRDALADDGWTIVGAECHAWDPTRIDRVAFLATKDLGGFVAVTTVAVGGTEARVSAYAPFHTEPSDPWGLPTVPAGTCLDTAARPTATSSDLPPGAGLFGSFGSFDAD